MFDHAQKAEKFLDRYLKSWKAKKNCSKLDEIRKKQARDVSSLYLKKSQMEKMIIWIALKFYLHDMNNFGEKTLEIPC